MHPGYGFPKELKLELVQDAGGGKRGKVIQVPGGLQAMRPGNNVVRLPGKDSTGRWIQIVADNLPRHNGRRTFAMGEIHVYRQDLTYPIKNIRLEGFPEKASSEAHLMMDGKSGGYPTLFLLDWLHLIE